MSEYRKTFKGQLDCFVIYKAEEYVWYNLPNLEFKFALRPLGCQFIE